MIKKHLEKLQFISNQNREKMDNKPKVDRRLFESNIVEYEKQQKIAEEYEAKVKAETTAQLNKLYNEISEDRKEVKYSIHKALYPLDAYFTNEFKTRALITKQRAESLALGSDKNWSLVSNWLDKEIQNNDVDFLSAFSDALKLNTTIPNEFRKEINQKLNGFQNKLGIDKLKNQEEAYDKLIEMGKVYSRMTDDYSGPEWKLEGSYLQNEIQQLAGEDIT